MNTLYSVILTVFCTVLVRYSSSIEEEDVPFSHDGQNEEDRYVNYFGNDEDRVYRMWSDMKRVYYDDYNETLLQLCTDIRQKATKNPSCPNATCAYIHPKILGFRNESYFQLRVDIVTCEVKETNEADSRTIAFHVTEGRRPDCVYMVEPPPKLPHLSEVDYVLGKLVCNITIDHSEFVLLDTSDE